MCFAAFLLVLLYNDCGLLMLMLAWLLFNSVDVGVYLLTFCGLFVYMIV